MFKKSLSVLLLLACTLSMTACWDHVEISNMLIVAGIGLDIDKDNKVYYATVEVVDVAAEGSENITAAIVEGSGDTVYSAIKDAMTTTGGSMFVNHCKVMVIGDRLARHGIDEIIDLVLRSPNLRKTLAIMVAKDATAKEILTQKTVKDDIVSYEMAKMLTSNTDTLNITESTSVYQLHEAFISNCPSGVTPVISTKKNGENDVLFIEGTAIFWQGELQGYLNGAQSGLYNIANHTVHSGTISVMDESMSEDPIEAQITRSAVHFTPHIQGDTLSMDVGVEVSAMLQGLAMLNVDLTDENNVDRLQNGLAMELETDIKDLITEVQTKYGTDIFDFNKEFEDRYRQEWPALSEDWQSHFKEIEVTVTANVSVKSSGLIGNYAPYGNEGNALP